MTKKELIAGIHANLGDALTKKQVSELVDATFGQIASAINDSGRYSHPGFGTFTVKTRAARTGRNPRTGDSIQIPESRTVSFKPAPELKKAL